MAVIFFDGFTRAIDTHYWAATGVTLSGDTVVISQSDPVTNKLLLSNIGTHLNKKLYLGLRVANYYVRDDQPFITFYASSNNAVLQLTWNTSDVAYPNVGINVVKVGSYLSGGGPPNSAGEPRYPISVNGQNYTITTMTGNYVTNATHFNTTEMPWWGDDATAQAWAAAAAQQIPAWTLGPSPSEPDVQFGWQRRLGPNDGYVIDTYSADYINSSSSNGSFFEDGLPPENFRYAVLDLGTTPISYTTTVTTFNVLNSIADVSWSLNGDIRYIFSENRVLEFEIDLVNNTLKIQYNGQSLFDGANADTATQLAIGNDLTAVALFGSVLSSTLVRDIYLVDDTGSFANTWLGVNFAVHAQNTQGFPTISTNWTAEPNLDGNYLHTNDSDISFVRTDALNAPLAYDLSTISPGGYNPVVAGIKVASVARRLQLNAAYKHIYRNQSTNTNYEMGERIVLTSPTYAQQPAQFINVNPETNAQWTVTQINSNAFGVKSVDPA